MPENKVMIYRHPNPDIRSFLTDEDISSFRVEIFKPPVDHRYNDTLESLGIIGTRVIKEAAIISGIRELHIKPHELYVKKMPPPYGKALKKK